MPATHTLQPRIPAPPAPPPGMNYVANIKARLPSTLLAYSFTVLLLPLVIALFYFSSRHSRRTPIFLLNLINISLALASGVLLVYRGIRFMVAPLDSPSLDFNITIGVLGDVQYILVDTILLLRLVAVYPPSYIGRKNFVMLLALPVLFKVARVINLATFIKVLHDATNDPVNPGARIAKQWSDSPHVKIEWFMQVIDNIYASGFFLWRLVLRNKEDRAVNSGFSATSGTFARRLRVLFWIAVTNFVLPALLSLTQIIIIYRDVDVVATNLVVLVNTKIAVFGAAFATIWAGSNRWNKRRDASQTSDQVEGGNHRVLSALVFNARSTHRSTTDVDSEKDRAPEGHGPESESEISSKHIA